MSVSLYGRTPSALSPPPLSEFSDSERSPRSSTSAATSAAQSPVSSRASVNAPEYSVSSCCKWGCCAAVTAAVKISHVNAGHSFATLNLVWVLCSAFCWIFHNRLCNFFFRCGCTWNWAGSWDRYARSLCTAPALSKRADTTRPSQVQRAQRARPSMPVVRRPQR
jgi:hypothetical protein